MPTTGLAPSSYAIVARQPPVSKIPRDQFIPRATDRQIKMTERWRVYMAEQYEECRYHWDGSPVVDPVRLLEQRRSGVPVHDSDAATGRKSNPRTRRPTMSTNLQPMVVDRMTEVIFGESTRPTVRLRLDELDDERRQKAETPSDRMGKKPAQEPGQPGQDPDDEPDPVTERQAALTQTLNKLCEDLELQATMSQARAMGGAMGSACVVATVVDGIVEIDCWDPRWVTPTFLDSQQRELASIEQRYITSDDEWDESSSSYRKVHRWNRRYIDQFWDIEYHPVPVPKKGQRVEWIPRSVYYHGLHFCPAVWICNTRIRDGYDGRPDMSDISVHSAHSVDMMISECATVIKRNADPIPYIALGKGDKKTDKIRMSSDDPVVTGEGGSAGILSFDATAARVGVEVAEKLMRWIARSASCVIDHPPSGTVTATEIMLWYSAMYARAGLLRHAWGKHGVAKVVIVVLRMLVTYHKRDTAQLEPSPAAIALLPKGVEAPERTLGIAEIAIPGCQEVEVDDLVSFLLPTTDKRPEIKRTATGHPEDVPTFDPDALAIRARLRAIVDLDWPKRFIEVGLQEVQNAVTAAAAAVAATLLDRRDAIRWLAPFFGVHDGDAMADKLELEAQRKLDIAMEQFAAGGDDDDDDDGDGDKPKSSGQPPDGDDDGDDDDDDDE